MGLPGGTFIADGNYADITGTAGVSLGRFFVNIPEPTTAGLLGLGILALTAAGRRRRH